MRPDQRLGLSGAGTAPFLGLAARAAGGPAGSLLAAAAGFRERAGGQAAAGAGRRGPRPGRRGIPHTAAIRRARRPARSPLSAPTSSRGPSPQPVAPQPPQACATSLDRSLLEASGREGLMWEHRCPEQMPDGFRSPCGLSPSQRPEIILATSRRVTDRLF